jgi:hypothetical protein
VAFNLIDKMRLTVGSPPNRHRLKLVNPATDNYVNFSRQEFTRTAAFIANPKSPSVTVLDPESKTTQLLMLFNMQRKRNWFKRILFGPLPPDIHPLNATTMETNFRAWVGLQECLNWTREQVAPVITAPAVESWLEMLTLGLVGKPSATNPVPVERLAGAVPPSQRDNMIRLLRGLRDAGLLSWTPQAQMLNPSTGDIMTNTNLYNILNYVFREGKTVHHASRYMPTGADKFLRKTFDLETMKGQMDDRVLRAVEQTAKGERR